MTRVVAACLKLSMVCALGGCSWSDDAMVLAIPAPAQCASSAQDEGQGPRIGILPFADKRHEPSMLGVKTGRFGTLDLHPLRLVGGDAGQAIATVLTRCLRGKGWRVRTDGEPDPGFPDVTLTGEVQDLSINAVTSGLSTRMTARAALVFEWTDQSDGARFRVPAVAEEGRAVYWFTKDDAERLINEVVAKDIDQFLQKIRRDGVRLRPV